MSSIEELTAELDATRRELDALTSQVAATTKKCGARIGASCDCCRRKRSTH